MSGNHRAVQGTNKTRVAVAGALTAGALLIGPIGVAVVAAPAGVAYAAPPAGGGDNGGPQGPGGGGTPPGGGSGGPNGPGGTVHKKTLRLPGLKVEIKNTVGDRKLPKLKIVPFPGLNRILHPPVAGGPSNCPSGPVGGGNDPGGPINCTR